MKSQLTKAPDGTITLTISLPKEAIATMRETAIEHLSTGVELPGFRKGKAPKKMVEEKLDPSMIQEEILKHLLPQAYTEAVNEQKIRPIVSPSIHMTKMDEGQDWEFTATTCETPEVQLSDYKDAVKSITAKSKIAVPGKEQKEVAFDEVMKVVMEKATVTIPSILVESEVQRLLSQTLDEIKSLGLTLDQYLGSTHKTIESLKEEYAKRAQQDITMEFVLQKIADEEKIAVHETELEEAITKAATPAEKENLEKNRYLLSAILRQQKTFDYLKSL